MNRRIPHLTFMVALLAGGPGCDKGDDNVVMTTTAGETSAGETTGLTDGTPSSSSPSTTVSSPSETVTTTAPEATGTTGEAGTTSADDSSTGETTTTGGSSALFMASPPLMVADVFFPVRADIDGDAADDLVISRNNSPSFIAILGAKPTEVQYYPGMGTGALAVVDLDADGDSDVLAAHYFPFPSKAMFASVRNDAAKFSDIVVHDMLECTNPLSVAVGDLDGDGNADAIVGCSFEFSLLRGTGDGGFAAPEELDFGVQYNTELALLDVVGSSALDLINIDSHGVVQVFAGDGDGTFTIPPAQEFMVDDPFTHAIGNIDGDGNPDILVSQALVGKCLVFFGSAGDGLTTGPQFECGPYPTDATLADFDGDGLDDVAAVTYFNSIPGELHIMLGHGDGTFAAPDIYPTPLDSINVEAGDFNGDGLQDVVVIAIDTVAFYLQMQ